MDLAKLDYWVSCAEQMNESPDRQRALLVVRNYSSDPELANAIIAREHIVISHIADAELGEMSLAWIDRSGELDHPPPGSRACLGDTDIEAALLCYVGACFGDELPIYIENPAPASNQPLN